jgi:hypothetical protein
LEILPIISLFSCSRTPTEEDKIRKSLIDEGFDIPRAAKYAKTAYKNGRTLDIIKQFERAINNNDYLNSKGILYSVTLSPDEEESGSPVALEHDDQGRHFQFILFLGSHNDFSLNDVEGVVLHEIRHLKAKLYKAQMLKDNTRGSLKSYFKEMGVKMHGTYVNDTFKRFFKTIDRYHIFTSRVEAEEYADFIGNIMEEDIVWANATEREMLSDVFQITANTPLSSYVEIVNKRKMDTAKMILALALYKVISDKHKVEIKSQCFREKYNKYQNDDLYKAAYDYLSICFDVSRNYFPK